MPASLPAQLFHLTCRPRSIKILLMNGIAKALRPETCAPSKQYRVLLALIIAVGLLIRLAGAFHHTRDLPQFDEGNIIASLLQHTFLELNPKDLYRGFVYSDLFYHFLRLLFDAAQASHLVFAFTGPFGLTPYEACLLISRIAVVLISSATIPLIYYIGKKMAGETAGIYSACLLALNPLHFSRSFVATADTVMVFFICAAWYYLLTLSSSERPRMRDYLLCGLCCGIAVALKYTAVFFVLLFILFCPRKRLPGSPAPRTLFLLFGGMAFLTFMVSNPFLFSEGGIFLRHLEEQYLRSYQGLCLRNPAILLKGWTAYPYLLIACFGFIGYGLLLLSIGYTIARPKKEYIFIFIYVGAYYFCMGYFKNSAPHYLLPVIPFLILIMADFLTRVTRAIGSAPLRSGSAKKILQALLIGAVLLGAGYRDAYYLAWLHQKDTRQSAKEWLLKKLPSTARLAVDAYDDTTPFICNRGESLPFQTDLIRWWQPSDTLRAHIQERRFDYIVVGARLELTASPLHSLIDSNYALIKEFTPALAIPRDVHNRIYNLAYNHRIRIYAKQKNLP